MSNEGANSISWTCTDREFTLKMVIVITRSAIKSVISEKIKNCEIMAIIKDVFYKAIKGFSRRGSHVIRYFGYN